MTQVPSKGVKRMKPTMIEQDDDPGRSRIQPSKMNLKDGNDDGYNAPSYDVLSLRAKGRPQR